MSHSINLVAYGKTKDGMLSESETVELIETSFITPALLDELELATPLATRDVYGPAGSTVDYSIKCFNDADIEHAINKLKSMFLTTLEADAQKLLTQGGESTKTIPIGYVKLGDSSAIDEAISRFRIITNVIYIFELKHKKYARDDSVVVKLG